MLRRVIPFLFFAALFLVVSCGTSISAQNNYASQMAPALEKLSKWQAHYSTLVTLFNAPVTAANGESMSRLQMIDLYNLATEYKITREDYVNLGFSPLDVLAGESATFAKEGKEIQDILSAATPDKSIQAAHQSLLKCVQTRSAYAEGLFSAIKNLGPVDLNGNDQACDTFDADLKKLKDYVNSNQ